MFPKAQDQTIDRLLGAQKSGPGDRSRLCGAFDADLASAYVERALTATEAARYEQHLGGCSPCRKAIIALTRLAQAESAPVIADKAVGRAAGEPWAKRWLHALNVPQWAMVATAVVVLAITLPLVLSNRTKSTDRQLATGTQSAQELAANPPRDAASNIASNDTTAAPVSADADREPGAAARKAVAGEPSATEEAKERRQGQPPAPASEQGAGVASVAQSQPAESQPADKTAAKAENQAQPDAPVAQPAAAAPLPKIDEKDAKKLAKEDDATNKTIKPGQVDGGARKAEGAIPSSEIAPPPVRARDESDSRRRVDDDRGVRSGPSAFGYRSAEPERSHPAIKVGGHYFFLRDGVWTDKDYDPNKDMPVVTFIRDSEVYRDLLAKEKKIKPFLTGFAVDQRVIFIFKDKVYKMIPQDGNR